MKVYVGLIMKIIERTITRPIGMLFFGWIYINFSLRIGKAVRLAQDCDIVIFPSDIIHFHGIYLQIGNMGGNIMIKSDKCLENWF